MSCSRRATASERRLASELGNLLDPWQPALLELVARTAAAGERAGVAVGICGEAGSDPLLALVLVGLGCTSLSMAASSLPEVQASLAVADLDRCRTLGQLALDAAGGQATRLAVAAG